MKVKGLAFRMLLVPFWAWPLSLFPSPVLAQDGLAARVLVVYNTAFPDSVEVADYYMVRRGIPEANRCPIRTDPDDDVNYFISLDSFLTKVRDPIQGCLTAVGPNNILYIVLTYLTPFKTYDGSFLTFSERSTDDLIADVWSPVIAYRRVHPYYAPSHSALDQYAPYTSFADFRDGLIGSPFYSVWRLDGYDKEQSKGLVDKAIQAETQGLAGQGCFDRRYGDIQYVQDSSYGSADWDIFKSAEFASAVGYEVTEDDNEAEFGTPPAPDRCDGAVFYSGWYSYGHYNDAFSWNTGAIGWHIDSLSCESPRSANTWSGGALANGITVTSGVVSEPFLDGIPVSDGVFRNLFEGANVGDAFLRNLPYVRWMNLFIGDPLYRPFPGGVPPFGGGGSARQPKVQRPGAIPPEALGKSNR